MVPLTLKLMVSLPLPALQPLTRAWLLAAVMASRKAQMPGAPGSASELTTIVAARAVVLKVTARIRDGKMDMVLIRPMTSPKFGPSGPVSRQFAL